FIFVDDVVDALTLAAQASGQERIFNIGSGIGRSVCDVLAAVEQALGVNLDVRWKAARPVDVAVSTLSIAKAQNKLGWRSKTSFEHGIAQTIAWWRSNAGLIRRLMPSASPVG